MGEKNSTENKNFGSFVVVGGVIVAFLLILPFLQISRGLQIFLTVIAGGVLLAIIIMQARENSKLLNQKNITETENQIKREEVEEKLRLQTQWNDSGVDGGLSAGLSFESRFGRGSLLSCRARDNRTT